MTMPELLTIILGIAAIGLLTRLLHVQQKIRKEVRLNRVLYQQTESLFGLYSQIDLKAPLPFMRKWAISPDFAIRLVDEMMKKKALRVVDFGSGTSTLLAAYTIKKYAGNKITDAKVYSFDHEQEFINKTQATLVLHEHQDIVDLVHAPVQSIELQGETFSFYDSQKLKEIQDIDLVIVDGPHGPRGILDRYPALPLVFEKLNDNAVIIVDDAANFEESKTLLEMWQRDYPNLHFELLPTEKGTAIFRK